MMSPTENEELMAKPGTEVSRLPKAPILAPFAIAWDVPGTDVASGDATSLLGFLSAISASTLKGKIATLGLPVSSAGLRLVCMSPLLTRTERGGRSSLFKPAVRVDMAVDGAIQVRLARGEVTSRVSWVWSNQKKKKKELHKVSAERPKVTVSSCLCDQIGVQGYNKAGVERGAANQRRDGLVPARLKKTVGKLTIVTLFFLHEPTSYKHKHNKLLMVRGLTRAKRFLLTRK